MIKDDYPNGTIMDEKELKELLEKYINGTASADEKRLVKSYYNHLLSTKGNDADRQMIERATSQMRSVISTHTQVAMPETLRRRLYTRWAKYAAVLILFMSATVVIYHYAQNDQAPEFVSVYGDDVLPGSNRATLSIAGRETITLSEEHQSLINDGSTIRYSDGTAVSAVEQIQIATVTTPVAGQYQVQLPDGSRAWLNASSSISYPTAFEGNERNIAITGEVFLEVFKNARQPFVVSAKNQRIEVLGTSFNVNSYADDGKLYTTLMEGSLKITCTGNNSSIVLRPGKQAIIAEDAAMTVRDIDTDEVSSWKEGFYLIKNQPLSLFGRQIERWYDVDIDMGSKGDIQLSALVPRDVNLSEVLQAIELKAGLRFKIQGRRVTVTD
jgi:transmembrane sensor